MPGDYTPSEIEPKWQAYWDTHKTFRTPNPGEPGFDVARRKFYALDMFPYPSGAGLHVGHPEGYTATDILSRYRRMCGDRVLHPMGWDAFGLPAEQHAVETGQHPAKTTETNINTFRRQMKALGFSYDWDREVATTAPAYFKWTQWIFLKLFNSGFDDATRKARPIAELEVPAEVTARGDKAVREFTDARRLAYMAEVPVNWCPVLGTVLSNEEVTNEGLSDRGNHPVFRRPMRQWMLRITKYADRLADDLADLDWPESIKLMQRNWIGRSEGAQVRFKVDGFDETIEVFTTRPDTLFGATYMVLAPEHPLVGKITTGACREAVARYCETAARKSDLARTVDAKEKTGVFTGAYAINPVWPKHGAVAPASRRCSPTEDSPSRIPILVADYVMMGYGTGAIMAVPAHDARDFEFVVAYNESSDAAASGICLDVRPVLQPPDDWLCDNWMSEEAGDRLVRLAGGQGDLEFGGSQQETARDLARWSGLPEDVCLSCVRIEESDERVTPPDYENLQTFYRRWPQCFVTSYDSDHGTSNSINSPPDDYAAARRCGTGVSPVDPITDQEHITDRNLPHIQRGGCTYFVTFRLRSGELSSAERRIVIDACDFWHGRKATIGAAVVMPDHVHLLLTPHEVGEGEWVPLGEILHNIKSYTAHRINELRGAAGAVWLDESFDRVVRDEAEYREKWEYIEANPVAASLVSRPSEYEWIILRSDVSFQETDHRRDAGATAPGPGDVCDINGLPSSEAKARIAAWLEEKGLGRAAIHYKLRDWLFSRQRYWGEPFPILHGPDGEIVPLDESELPLELPEIDDYHPVSSAEDCAELPDPPLGRATDWVTVERGGKVYRRELNTMPQWAGSCWYYLRFLDPHNDERFCSEAAERAWMVSPKKDGTPHAGGIDLYLGGAEHAVLHLLYARFWHKVLYDLGYVSTPEPFGKLFNQGMIRAFAYTDSRGTYVGYDDIDFREDGAYRKPDGEKLTGAVEKMSKSLKNVINPDEVVREYGADALRLYEMFMGPLDASKPWNPRDVPGVFRFLQRAFRLIADIDGDGLSPRVTDGETNAELERALHKTIRKVTDDLDRMAFNTAISAMMEFVNEAYRAQSIHKRQAERFVLMLSAFAPHLGEELWRRLRGGAWTGSLAYEPWPTYDEAMLAEESIEIPIQVNGKLVSRVTVAKDADEKAVVAAAQADKKLTARTDGGQIVKTIYVPGRMLNLIVKK